MKLKKKNKNDREYMAILNQPIEVLKKVYGSASRFWKGHNRCGALQSEKEEVTIRYQIRPFLLPNILRHQAFYHRKQVG